MKNKIKLIIAGISLVLVAGLYTFGVVAYNSYVNMRNERDRYIGNQNAYVDIINRKIDNARVLELTVADLRNSNDKMIHYTDSVRKSLKRPKNKPGDVSVGAGTSINVRDTNIIINQCDFKLDTTINYNKFTKSSIKINKDTLITGLNINNILSLFVYSHGEFVNTYKNGWIRFWHFDWKKEYVLKYDIVNSNDLIKTDSVRVYKMR